MEKSRQGVLERFRRAESHRDTEPPADEMVTLDGVVKVDPVKIAISSAGNNIFRKLL